MTDMETTTVDVDKPTVDVAVTDSAPVETKPETQEVKPVTEKPKRDKLQARFDKLTREKHEAEARAKQLEQQLSAVAPKTSEAPKREQFENYEEFVEAKAAYVAEQKVLQTIKAREDEERAKKQETETREVWSTWESRKESARDKYADFDEVINQDIPITPSMQQAILESDMGADVAYYLGTHPEEAERISKLSHARQLLEIGKLELKANEPKKPSSAPAPIDPVKPKGDLYDPNPNEKDSDEVWMAKRRKQLYGR